MYLCAQIFAYLSRWYNNILTSTQKLFNEINKKNDIKKMETLSFLFNFFKKCLINLLNLILVKNYINLFNKTIRYDLSLYLFKKNQIGYNFTPLLFVLFWVLLIMLWFLFFNPESLLIVLNRVMSFSWELWPIF